MRTGILRVSVLTSFFLTSFFQTAAAQRLAYETGNPVLVDTFVDPVTGRDENDGRSRETALRTLREAWMRLPAVPAETGHRIRLLPGVHDGAYLDERRGTFEFPVVITAADAPGTAVVGSTGGVGGLTLFDTAYVYLEDFHIAVRGGDSFHCERCDHVLLRRMRISSQWSDGQDESIKVNQSRHIYIEDSEIHGAGDNAIDMVAVQYGHIVRNRIHSARDWCLYLKGGSAYFRVEANEVYDCGTGGMTAGQGTGFQFMTPPWLHYETYDTKFVNNLIHDTEGAGLGVNGGYNILMAHNTMVRTGRFSHGLEFVFGLRSCDGEQGAPGREACQDFLTLGGWGTVAVDDGTNFTRIPNRNVIFFNNVLANPPDGQSRYQHMTVFGPYTGSSQDASNVPVPARADENLRLMGNVLWNGGGNLPLGIENDLSGCPDSNAACNEQQLLRDNAFNSLEPQFQDAGASDFRPLPGGNLDTARAVSLSPFPGGDRPERPETPEGVLSNQVATDFTGTARGDTTPPGAFVPSIAVFEETFFVPVVLSVNGANGSFYTSELALTNRGTTPARVRLSYVSSMGDGNGTAEDVLSPGRQKVVPDAIEYLRTLGITIPASGNRLGTLRVTFSNLSSRGTGAVTARATTPVTNGRAGLSYSGVAVTALLKSTAYLCGLRQNTTDRSNVALQNAGEESQGDITLRVTVYSGDPSRPAEFDAGEVVLPPGGFHQLSEILKGTGFSTGFVRIDRVSGTAPFYAYAAINDQPTSDGSFVEPVPAILHAGRTGQSLPVMVETGPYTSELVLTNTLRRSRRITLRYQSSVISTPDASTSVDVELGPLEQRFVPEFVQFLRSENAAGVGPRGPDFVGALRVTATDGDLEGLVTGARTTNPGGGGTFGLFYGATGRFGGAVAAAYVYGLRQDAENRTNLALVNTGEKDGSDSVYRIEIFDGDTGMLAATVEGDDTAVPAGGFRQLNAIMAAHAPGKVNGYARITRRRGTNPFLVYAVVNDGAVPGERSGDGAFVKMTGGEE